MPTFHLLIIGRVQGVFYRVSAKKMAEIIGITGWIRNTKNGHVESLITGEDEQLEKFKTWCKQGPANAEVVSLTEKRCADIFFKEFEIR